MLYLCGCCCNLYMNKKIFLFFFRYQQQTVYHRLWSKPKTRTCTNHVGFSNGWIIFLVKLWGCWRHTIQVQEGIRYPSKLSLKLSIYMYIMMVFSSMIATQLCHVKIVLHVNIHSILIIVLSLIVHSLASKLLKCICKEMSYLHHYL
jgi:hypothetical protein